MLTRKTREHLMSAGEDDFMLMKGDLMNEEVIEMAIELHSILALITNKYSNDAIVELIPELIKLLSRLDASLKVNTDLKSCLGDIGNENDVLKKRLELEKQNRKDDLEESISYEEKSVNEIGLLKAHIQDMTVTENNLKKELESQKMIVSVLKEDIQDLTLKLESQELELLSLRSRQPHDEWYTIPMSAQKQRPASSDSWTIETNNRFLPLSINRTEPISEKGENVITVKAQVHRAESYSPNKCSSTPSATDNPRKPHRRIVVLADSHGKDLYRHLQELNSEYDIFVYTKPGAKMKTVIKEGKHFIEDLSKDDYVVILAGTNDMDIWEPGQLTMSEGLNYLLSLNIETNVIINSIPYRYDTACLNDNIYFVNMSITKRIREYKGTLNLIHGEINLLLQRCHYTTHGLHLNKRGKRFVGKAIVDTVRRRSSQSVITGTQSTLPLRGKKLLTNRTTEQVDDSIYPDPDYTPSPERSTSCSPTFVQYTSHPSLESLTDFPPLISDNSLLHTSVLMTSNDDASISTPALAHQQHQGVSLIDRDNPGAEDQFRLSRDECLPLLPSPGAPVSIRQFEPDLPFLGKGENCQVLM